MNRSQNSDNLHAVYFWIGVLVFYVGAIFIRGTTMTGDGPVHWVASVYVGSCFPPFGQLIEMYGIPSGPVPYLIWGGFGKVLGYNPLLLRAVSTTVSLAFAFICWTVLRKKTKHHYMAVMLLLSYAYFFLPSHSILTDNFGLFFLSVFFMTVISSRSVSALKGVIGTIALCLALYSRIWYLIFPFTYIVVALYGYYLRQRANPAKILICLIGILSIAYLPAYWGGFVQPSMQYKHYTAFTVWLPVLVVSTVGAYLWPLVLLMSIRRTTWIMTGFLSPFFLLFRGSSSVMSGTKFIGGVAHKGLFAAGELLLGGQNAEWIFFPFWIIGLALLVHMLRSAYYEIRRSESVSESPLAILCVASLGFLGANMMVPYWTERYLSPFFVCIIPFIPGLIKRWEKMAWAWIAVLCIIALSHLVMHATGYKRAKIVVYKGVETTLNELYVKNTDSLGDFRGDEKIVKALSCLKNDELQASYIADENILMTITSDQGRDSNP